MPNSLWHIDGHLKLIRWRIVIYSGIDGYSRLPVYLRASTNNRADTVLQCFLDAVRSLGLPSRVRCDRGGENVMVSEFMLNHLECGPERGSCITGRSVHNQRIERLWRDLFTGCIYCSMIFSYTLEDTGVLCPSNNTDLFALHYVFILRINFQLDVFRQSYSQHRLRTARNQSPFQLWTRGLAQESGDYAAIQGVLGDFLVRTHLCKLIGAFVMTVDLYISCIELHACLLLYRVTMALTRVGQCQQKVTWTSWRSLLH